MLGSKDHRWKRVSPWSFGGNRSRSLPRIGEIRSKRSSLSGYLDRSSRGFHLSHWERSARSAGRGVTVSRERAPPSPDLLRKSTSPRRGEVGSETDRSFCSSVLL